MNENQTDVVNFLNFLSNPNALTSNDLGEIKNWVEKYPYSQSLKFIAIKAAKQNSNYSDLLAQAATIAPSRKLLYNFIQQPESFNSTVVPFSDNYAQTTEDRQIAIASEEHLDDVEDKSMLSFGININEIYGSEYKKEIPVKSPLENIEDENQEEASASADEELEKEEIQEFESEIAVENIDEEIGRAHV